MQKKILVPTNGINSWRDLLADPGKQWKDGYSAKSVAKSWEKDEDLPAQIKEVLEEEFGNLELLHAVPEFKVPLPGGNRDSQNDVFGIIKAKDSLISMMVEAKVKEDFGSIIEIWEKEFSEGKENRLKFLEDKINIPKSYSKQLRYQLFHRLASSIIMAEKYNAQNAIMVIQSFEKDNKLNHFDDFVKFINTYIPNLSVNKNQIIKLTSNNEIDIYSAWIEC